MKNHSVGVTGWRPFAAKRARVVGLGTAAIALILSPLAARAQDLGGWQSPVHELQILQREAQSKTSISMGQMLNGRLDKLGEEWRQQQRGKYAAALASMEPRGRRVIAQGRATTQIVRIPAARSAIPQLYIKAYLEPNSPADGASLLQDFRRVLDQHPKMLKKAGLPDFAPSNVADTLAYCLLISYNVGRGAGQGTPTALDVAIRDRLRAGLKRDAAFQSLTATQKRELHESSALRAHHLLEIAGSSDAKRRQNNRYAAKREFRELTASYARSLLRGVPTYMNPDEVTLTMRGIEPLGTPVGTLNRKTASSPKPVSNSKKPPTIQKPTSQNARTTKNSLLVAPATSQTEAELKRAEQQFEDFFARGRARRKVLDAQKEAAQGN